MKRHLPLAMDHRVFRSSAVVVFLFATFLIGPAVYGQQARPLDHDDVNAWNHISTRAISDNGDWALWVVGPAEGDSELHIRHTGRSTHVIVPRGESPRFTGDGSYVVFMKRASFDSTRQAKIDDRKKDDMPTDSVGIVELQTGRISLLDPAVSFKVAADSGDWFAYLLTEQASKPDSSSADTSAAKTAETEESAAADSAKVETPDKPDTSTLVVYDPSDMTSTRIPNTASYEFSDDGNWLAVSLSTKTGDEDGVYLLEPGTNVPVMIQSGEGRYSSLVFDDAATRLAFMSDRSDWPSKTPAMDVYITQLGDAQASKVVESRHPNLPEGWWVSEHGSLRFSDSGARLFFGTAPEPAADPDDEAELPDNETIELDIWAWTDPLLQPQQLVQADRERKRTYDAMLVLSEGRVVQLADDTLPDVTVADEGDGSVALGESDLPYRQRISWDSPSYRDAYVVDLATGKRSAVFVDRQANASLSPTGRYAYWWDGHEKAWFASNTKSGVEVNLTGGLGVPVHNHLDDRPQIPGPEGSAGWTANDALFIVYDKHDVWAIDPEKPGDARMITEGVGRAENLRFRVVDLDFDEPAVEEELVLAVFDFATKDQGWYADRITGSSRPRRLTGGPAEYGGLRKADDADRYIFSRETFREYPDVWTTDAAFRSPQKLSDANPQQASFRWGTSELVQWTSLDGQVLDGILYKPDGFDASRKYPMMVYFYEKSSAGLHGHFAPRASRSSIDRSFYVSRGYLLFVPDIPYKDGYPGESAMNAVMPGITSLIDAGFVDRDRIGVQGHSWGGYQIAYMVTQTNLFAAAEAGAPVSNMTSAYGGIRWASGMSRMFQYEKTQSRIAGTLWDAQHRYIDNSPLFQADKVQTPLLMMHNDEDGAVPWYQGIEFFVALRRLGKPVWMLNYNGEAHGLTNLHNQRDWAIRMQQFFDHYLMDAPAPVWLVSGVPAVEKGKTLGLDLMH